MNRKRMLWTTAVAAACALALLCGASCKGRSNEGVMARVNGRKILRSDLDMYYRNRAEGQPEPAPEQAQILRLNILREMIDTEILMQRAEKLGLVATDQELDDKLKEIHAPYTNEEFDQRLKQRHLTLDDFRRDLRRSIVVDKVLNKEIADKVKVSDADISNYYNQHTAEFNYISPQYHLAQIMVTTHPNPQVHNLKNDKAQNESEAKQKIVMLATRLASGEDFGKLAMAYSEQPETAASSGDLGFIPENVLQGDRMAFDAISRLKPGEYTPPLPAADPSSHQLVAFRIVKLISREPAGQRDLKDAQVQDAIRGQLRDAREQLVKSAYLEAMHDKASVENYLADEILKSTGQ